MATSRYGSSSGDTGTLVQPQLTGTSTTSSGSSTGTSTTSQAGSKTYQQSSMDAASQDALNQLIAQLLGGGTQGQALETAQRQQEIQSVRGQRAGYSREAALADAEGLMSQQLRQVMEKLEPSLTRASEGAGTSQNSMRALMLQDIAARAAESSSVAGIDAVSKYGALGVGLSQVLEALTRPQDTTTQALLNALNIAKGANVSGSEQTTLDSSTNTSQQTQQQENKSMNYSAPTYATSTTPAGSSSGSSSGSGIYGFRGEDAESGIFSNAGIPDPWESYTTF